MIQKRNNVTEFSSTKLGHFSSKYILHDEAPSAILSPGVSFQNHLRQLHRARIWFTWAKDGRKEAKHLPLSPVEAASCYPVAVILAWSSGKLPPQLLVSSGWVVALEMVVKVVNLCPRLQPLA